MFLTAAGVGLSFASFTFQGDDSYESDLEFNNNLININFSTPGLDLFTTFGGGISGMKNTSYLNVGARISNHFLLQRSENFLLTIPIQLSSDLTQVTSSVSDQDFRQSTLVAGTGLSSLARFTERLSLQVKRRQITDLALPRVLSSVALSSEWMDVPCSPSTGFLAGMHSVWVTTLTTRVIISILT